MPIEKQEKITPTFRQLAPPYPALDADIQKTAGNVMLGYAGPADPKQNILTSQPTVLDSLKDAGVKHLFLNFPRDFQPLVDKLIKDADPETAKKGFVQALVANDRDSTIPAERKQRTYEALADTALRAHDRGMEIHLADMPYPSSDKKVLELSKDTQSLYNVAVENFKEQHKKEIVAQGNLNRMLADPVQQAKFTKEVLSYMGDKNPQSLAELLNFKKTQQLAHDQQMQAFIKDQSKGETFAAILPRQDIRNIDLSARRIEIYSDQDMQALVKATPTYKGVAEADSTFTIKENQLQPAAAKIAAPQPAPAATTRPG